jgi:hypothetical protein
VLLFSACVANAADSSFIDQLQKVDVVGSTVPANGDLNPYGIARVPKSVGKLNEGNFLISNFNNSANHQGTGTTIVQISPQGAISLFAQIDAKSLPGSCPGGVGLTTALVVLRSGFVIVGSLPTSDGTSATMKAGCLLVLNSDGNVVRTISGGPINGPWDMTALDGGNLALLFVTNVLNGTVENSPNQVNQGTVVRLLLSTAPNQKPAVLLSTIVASGLAQKTDPTALVIGPTGVAFDPQHNVLYVADSVNNRIAAVQNAATRLTSANTGITVSQNGFLNDPLGMAFAPNGNIVTANGNDGNLVETTPTGTQVAKKLVDNTSSPPALPGAGTLFGIAVNNQSVYFVNDGSNTLNLLH